MENNRKNFLDKVVRDLRFPVTDDFNFFDITDIGEMKYILTKYFMKDYHNTIHINIESYKINVSVSYNTKEHYRYCTLYNENTYIKQYSIYEYDDNGNNTLYVVNNEEQPLLV